MRKFANKVMVWLMKRHPEINWMKFAFLIAEKRDDIIENITGRVSAWIDLIAEKITLTRARLNKFMERFEGEIVELVR